MKAECACGSLTVETKGPPERTSICHCDACRTRTGTAFSWNARFQVSDVRIMGKSRSFDRKGDDGGTVTSHFCEICGVMVYYENSGVDGIMIPMGAVVGETPVPPSVSVYHNRKPNWLSVNVKQCLG